MDELVPGIVMRRCAMAELDCQVKVPMTRDDAVATPTVVAVRSGS